MATAARASNGLARRPRLGVTHWVTLIDCQAMRVLVQESSLVARSCACQGATRRGRSVGESPPCQLAILDRAARAIVAAFVDDRHTVDCSGSVERDMAGDLTAPVARTASVNLKRSHSGLAGPEQGLPEQIKAAFSPGPIRTRVCVV